MLGMARDKSAASTHLEVMGTTKKGNKIMAIGMVSHSDFIGTENLREKNHTNHAATNGNENINMLAMRCVRFMIVDVRDLASKRVMFRCYCGKPIIGCVFFGLDRSFFL